MNGKWILNQVFFLLRIYYDVEELKIYLNIHMLWNNLWIFMNWMKTIQNESVIYEKLTYLKKSFTIINPFSSMKYVLIGLNVIDKLQEYLDRYAKCD